MSYFGMNVLPEEIVLLWLEWYDRYHRCIESPDAAGVEIYHVELDEPSLDDVFADATGRP